MSKFHRKLLNLIVLAIIAANLFAPSVYAAFCQNKMAIPTIEGLGKEETGHYEAGWSQTTCSKIQKGATQGPPPPDAPYIINTCSEPVYTTDCTPTDKEKAMDPQNSDSVIICQPVYFVCGDTGADLLKNYIRTIYLWGASMCAIIAVLLIVLSGVQISMSGGDSSKVEEARNRIFQSLSGLVLLFLSGLILYTINPTFFIFE